MSILIKGMEMPKRCLVCPFMVSRDNDDCILQSDEANTKFNSWDDMKASCPLIELPPHGRLVDADKLMMSLADWWYSSFGEEETDEAKAIRKVLDTVEQSIGAMTVVEAEGVTE